MNDENGNGFKVVDIPAGVRKGSPFIDYKSFFARVKELPEGKALEISFEGSTSKQPSNNLHTLAARHGLVIRTKRISDRVYAVWKREQ